MLSRIFSLHSRANLRLLSCNFNPIPSPIPKLPFFPNPRHQFSTNNNGNGEKPTSGLWKIAPESDDLDDIFGTRGEKLPKKGGESGKLGSFDNVRSWEIGGKLRKNDNLDDFLDARAENLSSGGREVKKAGSLGVERSWVLGGNEGGHGGVFEEFEKGGRGVEIESPWDLRAEKEGSVEEVFEIEGETGLGGDFNEDGKTREEREMIAAAQKLQLEKEEQSLLEVIKGPDRAFGDLVAASGITDAMLDSLIALKNFQDIEGLPPLPQIEDERYGKTLLKSSRYEMELQKQEDAANARVRKVDEKGRAYGTGKRKCSIARVWIQPGEGKFNINDKEFDVYFPMLDHRAALLRPFSETNTLGLWDVMCTVKGGGTTGQVDAIRLGVSRALQNWEPGLRPPLKAAGFLTRDPRIVERKKPGKAKARKSFQWVKR